MSIRVAEIQETVDTQAFKYIQSQHNSADALTRRIPEDQLTEWMDGPPFLKLPDEDWPTFDTPSPKETDHVASNELKNSDQHSIDASKSSKEKIGNPILDHLTKSCSSFCKTRKTLAYVRRVVTNVKTKNKAHRSKGPISVKEFKKSENLLFKWSQLKIDHDTLSKKLAVRRDENGILRDHGRLENVNLPDDVRNPVVLTKNDRLTHLLLLHLHEKRAHCGYQSLMYEARKKFWIVGLRLLTRKCITCRKIRGKALEQLMGQLPSLRVAPGFPPFCNTALDMLNS